MGDSLRNMAESLMASGEIVARVATGDRLDDGRTLQREGEREREREREHNCVLQSAACVTVSMIVWFSNNEGPAHKETVPSRSPPTPPTPLCHSRPKKVVKSSPSLLPLIRRTLEKKKQGQQERHAGKKPTQP